MARRPEPEGDAFTQLELDELRNNLARLNGLSLEDFYRAAYRECSVERKPGAKAVQRLVTAWNIEAVGMEVGTENDECNRLFTTTTPGDA